MAHGSKKWICAMDTAGGRVKRSRHRSNEDKLGRLVISASVCSCDRWREWTWLSHAPKSFRRQIEGRYRACVRNLMDKERYDELPQRGPRDAAWDYW